MTSIHDPDPTPPPHHSHENGSDHPPAEAAAPPDSAALLRLAANTVRALAMDAVQQANSGHPGMPMGTADLAVVLWTQFLRHNPADPRWPNRDRFVLSAGHGSMLLYSLLHLSGYDLPLAELQRFRQWGSRTPGHPEYGHTPGVETTTGPLGQGITNAVGLALAEAWQAAVYNRPGFTVVDHHTYVIAGDGDMMEGISHEACALAGHWGLHKLIVLYDDNGITIDGPTALAMSEDVAARFVAYGWRVQRVDGHDAEAVAEALHQAQAETERPSLILCRTHIGYGSPHKQDTAHAHGEPLGVEEVARAKERLGWTAPDTFYVPEAVYAFMQGAAAAGGHAQAAWQAMFEQYRVAHPALAAQFETAQAGRLPADWLTALPHFPVGGSVATRNASGKVLEALIPHLPTLLGGSADLTGSNKTLVRGMDRWTRAQPAGRYLHFGVREHGMGGILNGLTLHGGLRVYGGTFLVFSDYMRGAIRLAALMGLPVIYVLTHDSIGLGEDGPTHQPVEQLMSLRAIPNLVVFRPADANETAVAWRVALERTSGPMALALTRQNLPTLEGPTDQAARGGYILRDSDHPQAIILATGSEVSLAVAAYDQLRQSGIATRVVSLPSWELFQAQPAAYRQQVLPPHITARVSIEAGVTLGWERYVGPWGRAIGLDRFGASAPYEEVYAQLGLTAEAIVQAVRAQVS